MVELFLTLVLSAAFVGLIWHAARWAFHMDAKYPRPKHRRRKDQTRINAQFEEIVDDLRKDTQ